MNFMWTMNYLNYIKKSKIIKRSEIQVNIPTYNSYKTIKETIESLYNQKNINFDVLVIDNGSNDYEKLIKDFPNLNYCLLKENTGSSGAQRIGAEIGLKYGYKYILFTDNDAVLLDEYGLSKMKKNFKNSEAFCAIVPQNIELNDPKNSEREIEELKAFFPLHYLFTKSSILKNTGLHDFYMFLSGDDVSLVSKILSFGKIIVDKNVLFYHPVFKPRSIQNKNIFLTIRSLTILIFFENNINFRWRFRALMYVFFIFLQAVFHSIRVFDFSYFKTGILILKSFIYGYKDMDRTKELIRKVPQNKYILVEVKCLDNAKRISMFNIFFLIYKNYYFYSNYLKRNIYFKLTSNNKVI